MRYFALSPLSSFVPRGRSVTSHIARCGLLGLATLTAVACPISGCRVRARGPPVPQSLPLYFLSGRSPKEVARWTPVSVVKLPARCHFRLTTWFLSTWDLGC
jgi:hypothetical protein